MKKLLALVCMFSALLTVSAQDDPEYRMEVGGGLGLVSYQGDFNSSLTGGMQPMAALVAKYRYNPRMALGASICFGKIKGSSRDVKTWYPETAEVPYSFNSQLIDLTVRYEYNFWAYGTGQEYYGARRVAPFIALGLGLTHADAKKGVFTANLPLGFGVKAKLGERLNLTAEWSMHFTGSDELDGMKDPYGIKSSGLFKNTDCFSVLQIALTYDIWAKCKTCNNDR
jgi:hypothetical protein